MLVDRCLLLTSTMQRCVLANIYEPLPTQYLISRDYGRHSEEMQLTLKRLGGFIYRHLGQSQLDRVAL